MLVLLHTTKKTTVMAIAEFPVSYKMCFTTFKCLESNTQFWGKKSSIISKGEIGLSTLWKFSPKYSIFTLYSWSYPCRPTHNPSELLITLQNYRVSRKTLATFVFWISRLPRGLEIPYWTFFNSPFCVDFRNIQFFIIWWNMEWDIVKILHRGHFKT